MRYYEKIIAKELSAISTGFAYTNTTFRGLINYSKKRTIPTITSGSASKYYISGTNNVNVTNVDVATNAGESSTKIEFISNVGGLNVGQAYLIRILSGQIGEISIDAEL